MSRSRDYFEKKQDNDKNEFRHKLLRHRLTIFYRTLLVILVLAAISIALYFNYKNMIYTDYEVVKRVEFEETSTASYMNYNGNILKFSQDGAIAFTMDDTMLWNETYEMQNPMVDIAGEYVVLGDYMGTQIYVMNSTGKCGEIDAMLPVQKFCVSASGTVAAVLEDGATTWIRVYDKEGTTIADIKTTMAISGYPISIALSDDGIKLVVSYLFIDSGILTTTVGFYNFGAVGQNEIDNFVSGYNYSDTVVSYVDFVNNETAIGVGDDKFVIYRGNQKPVSEFELPLEEEIRSVFHGDKYTGLVFASGNSGTKYRIDVYDEAGGLAFTKDFDIEYTDIVLHGELVIIYSSSNCAIYNINGVEKYAGTFDKSVLTVIPTESLTRFLLITSNRAEEIQLK